MGGFSCITTSVKYRGTSLGFYVTAHLVEKQDKYFVNGASCCNKPLIESRINLQHCLQRLPKQRFCLDDSFLTANLQLTRDPLNCSIQRRSPTVCRRHCRDSQTKTRVSNPAAEARSASGREETGELHGRAKRKNGQL